MNSTEQIALVSKWDNNQLNRCTARRKYEALMHKNRNNISNDINSIRFNRNDKLADARVVINVISMVLQSSLRSIFRKENAKHKKDTFYSKLSANFI